MNGLDRELMIKHISDCFSNKAYSAWSLERKAATACDHYDEEQTRLAAVKKAPAPRPPYMD